MKWVLIFLSLAVSQAHALALSEDQAIKELFSLIPGDVPQPQPGKLRETLRLERSGRLDSWVNKNCSVLLEKGGGFDGFSAELKVNGAYKARFDTAMRKFKSARIESELVEAVYIRTQSIGGKQTIERIVIEKDNNNNITGISVENKDGKGTCLFY